MVGPPLELLDVFSFLLKFLILDASSNSLTSETHFPYPMPEWGLCLLADITPGLWY